MIYVLGTFGFICGFFLGQMILIKLLKDVPKEELLNNQSSHWQYGVLNWIIAVLTAASFVWIYNYHFG